MGCWIFITKESQDLSNSMFLSDWKSSISLNIPRGCNGFMPWKPPNEGVLKMNFDSPSKGNLGPEGFGCVVGEFMQF